MYGILTFVVFFSVAAFSGQ